MGRSFHGYRERGDWDWERPHHHAVGAATWDEYLRLKRPPEPVAVIHRRIDRKVAEEYPRVLKEIGL